MEGRYVEVAARFLRTHRLPGVQKKRGETDPDKMSTLKPPKNKRAVALHGMTGAVGKYSGMSNEFNMVAAYREALSRRTSRGFT